MLKKAFYQGMGEGVDQMSHPCHKQEIVSLKRIEGQVRGVSKMIDQGKYCVDILNQIKAIKNSLSTVEGKILKTHLKHCVRESLESHDDFDDKVDEILMILKR